MATHLNLTPWTTWEYMTTLVSNLREGASVASFLETRSYNEMPERWKLRYPESCIPDIVARGSWFKRETERYSMHPVIKQAVELCKPDDWHLLVLEYPHMSNQDRTRIAYTRSQEHGVADRQTVTSVGKYLSRHFPKMSQSDLRDLVMRHGADRFEIWDTTAKMVEAVQNGPRSCMQWCDGDVDSDGMNHPYAAYDPQLGWRMAVRFEGSHVIMGRCIINNTNHTYVRSYRRNDDGYSHSDEALEVWLADQGYSKADSWLGLQLRAVEGRRGTLAPYLDGVHKEVSLDVANRTMQVEEDGGGEYILENTNGMMCEVQHSYCADCDDHIDEDNTAYIEDHGHVCDGCLDANYVHAIAAYGYYYYVSQGDAVYVESQSEYYALSHLERNGIVELDNGDYEHRDNAAYLDYRGVWVERDDDCVVYCEASCNYEHVDDCVQLHDGEWAIEDDCEQCDVTGEWYLAAEYEIRSLSNLQTKQNVRASDDGIAQEYEPTFEEA